MIAPITYIEPLVTLLRRRRLPVDGKVLVSLGDQVLAKTPVAQSALGSKLLILDASRALGIPPERAVSMIQRKVGDKVEEGAIIAGRRGVGARQLRAPATGTIAAISESQVLFQVADESSTMLARVPGSVVDIEPERGVTVEFVGAWAQGVWGNGRLGDGILNLLSDNPGDVLTADEVDMNLRGAVLVAGTCDQRQALELAAQVPLRGLILGSLAIRLVPLADKLPYPILVTEGFGSAPMNSDAFKLFTNHSGDPITLNAQRGDAFSGERPEVLIPIREAGRPPQPVAMQSFRIGQTIRVLNGADRGVVGEITTMLTSASPFPSGIRAMSAEVTLETGTRRIVPLANLELLG